MLETTPFLPIHLAIAEDCSQHQQIFCWLSDLLGDLPSYRYQITVERLTETSDLSILQIGDSRISFTTIASHQNPKLLIKQTLFQAMYPEARHGLFSWPWF